MDLNDEEMQTILDESNTVQRVLEATLNRWQKKQLSRLLELHGVYMQNVDDF